MGRNKEILDRAIKMIPGQSQLLSKRADLFSLGVWPAYFSKAKGAEVWDLDDNKYIDMSLSGVGANVLGYADEDVDKAVINVIEKGTSTTLNCAEEVELAEVLCELHPWAEKVRYARTGGESMAVAIRIVRSFTGREKIAFCGYHGWHDWYLAANIGTEDALGGHLIPGLEPEGVPKGLKGTALPFGYNNIESLKKIIEENPGELAAIVMEPVRNINPEAGFLEEVREIAKDQNAVFVFDEISSGFRMNTGGAHMLYGVEPDMCVFAKSLGNGYPMGAVIGRGDVMDAAVKSFISSTYWTERIGPTAALAMIKKHKENNVGAHLMEIGKAVQEGWKEAAEKNSLDIEVSGIYPLSHFVFKYDNAPVMKAYFIQEMLERGFLASVQFYSMYAHTAEHVSKYLKSVDEIFCKLSQLNKEGNLEESLKGQPAKPAFKKMT